MSDTAKNPEKPVGITCPNCAGDHVDLIGYSAFDENYECQNCGHEFEKTRWVEFGKEPVEGVYWVCGTYPEYDCDVDDYGKTVGKMTGKSIPFVSLVQISFDPAPDGFFEVRALGQETGEFHDDYGITHYLPMDPPKPPKSCR